MRVLAKQGVNDHLYDEFNHQGIAPGSQYLVISVECDSYRIAGLDCDPVLYPMYLLDVIDETIPSDWIRRFDPDTGECFYHGPAQFGVPGFREKYLDGNPEAIVAFHRYMRNKA